MSAQQSKGGDSAALGIGNLTSGEEGSTPTHETMAETGGSGGDALTKPRNEEVAPSNQSRQSSQSGNRQGDDAGQPEGAGSAATATGPGKQDTRSQQAGIKPTGLGTPETGGNQSEDDLAPPYQK
jgi:hypothetical protein